ncbi:aminopeptidase PepB [Paraglaciecola hydrolytica]|uniref:Aminopeptidase n=1 Tax=Paraglaciecola hydrolytica TaxID=1799789 RepID=A0A136A3J5_9ALTE|nr:aminopeptidase PepB [Paraglaciecola hydrolytica]KXI29710.1 aminopeptidase [Paraglaciecola hydrolytica]
MSTCAIYLTTAPKPTYLAKGSLVSLDGNQAYIHLVDATGELTQIQKAARVLDGMGLQHVKLQGDWQIEQQWAFALSFTAAKKPSQIEWLDNKDRAELQHRFQAMQFTRQLINATPEDQSPELLAQACSDWLKTLTPHAVTSNFIVGEDLKTQGWHGIYQVGRGSTRPPVLAVIDFNPSKDPKSPVEACLVGKGITFDSGGYSIKASEGMLSMKCDMGGAATVVGGLGLAILRGLNKRVKVFLCCAENLISGHAYKLGDIITYKNGTTVEIVNTDAEGRLVLADGLMAASETGAPLIIDAATLTGAAHVALGDEYNALFALDKSLQSRVMAYAQQENEGAWCLPLEKFHREKCPSHFADTANSRAQKGGGSGGASNAAGFLSRFVNEDGTGWIHMDLAAAYNANASNMLPAGATAQGFRTIARTLIEG